MTGLFGKLARRYLLGKKGRSLMTLLGIALGVTMVVAVFLLNSAILASYENLLAATAGKADLQVSATTGFGFPERLLDEAQQATGVATAAPAVTSSSPVTAGGKQSGATFYGIIPERDRQVREYNMSAGRLPASGASRETAVSLDLAKALSITEGSKLSLLTTKGMTEFTVVGIFDAGGTARGALGPFGVMDLKTAQEVFAKEGKLDLIDLILAPNADPASTETALAEALGPQVRVGTPVERSKDMQKLLDSVTFVLTLAGSLSLFAGAFIIYTNVSMGVAERRRDLSILRALGMRRGEVLRLVLLEAGFLGFLGACLGLTWGYGLAATLAQQMGSQFLKGYGLEVAAVTLSAGTALVAFAVGTGTAVFAAFGPARETVRVTPVDAMRPDGGASGKRERNGWGRALAGLAFITVGALGVWLTWPRESMLSPLMLRFWGLLLATMLLGMVIALPALLPVINRWLLRPLLQGVLGITGRLASDNLVRQPRRTAATICSLMVSLTYMVAMGGVSASQIGTFDRWYEKTVAWDMNISTSYTAIGAMVEMDPAFERELAAIDGVRLVSPQKMGRVILADGEQAFMQVFDHRLLRQYSQTILDEGEPAAAIDAMERGGHAIISPAVARRLNVGLGDRMTVPAPGGTLDLTVAGIMTDITPYGGTVQIDRQDYLTHWKDQTSTNIAVMVEPGEEPAEVKERIIKHFEGRAPLTVRLNQEFWSELRAQYDGFYKLMDGLIWIAVVVSGLAIANTLFSSILERRREVGVMRAVGTRRGEVMRVVVGEAFGTGLIGGLIGVMAGLVLHWVMTTSTEFINGTSSDWIISWSSIGMAAGVSLLLAPLVGFLPARWAARMDVVDALRYE